MWIIPFSCIIGLSKSSWGEIKKMSLEDDFKEKLKDADFKYFDSLVKEAIHDHRKSFSFSRQHFETMHDAQETMREWQFSRDVIAHIDIDPIEITVHLRTES